MASLGWNEHVNKVGTPCAYCGEPSTRTLVIEPDAYSNGELKRRGIRAGVCDAHVPQQMEDVADAVSFRRRKAKDVEQLTIDTGDVPKKKGAIFGIDQG
jgi:hypothetical protein